MTFDVFHHDDRVIDDETDRQHDREEREQVQGEPEELHKEQRADERDRDRHDRHDHGSHRAEEQKDHHHHDQQGVDQRFHYFADGVTDVRRRVVGDFARHSGRKFFSDLLHLGAHPFDHVHRVGIRQNRDSYEDGLLPGETDLGVVVFCAEHHVSDIAQPDQRALVLPHY